MKKFLAVVAGALVAIVIDKLLKNKEANDQTNRTGLQNPPKPSKGTPN